MAGRPPAGSLAQVLRQTWRDQGTPEPGSGHVPGRGRARRLDFHAGGSGGVTLLRARRQLFEWNVAIRDVRTGGMITLGRMSANTSTYTVPNPWEHGCDDALSKASTPSWAEIGRWKPMNSRLENGYANCFTKCFTSPVQRRPGTPQNDYQPPKTFSNIRRLGPIMS